ncbi:hypothetical protein FACS189437_00620 [Bacteroidia bacterium]|nr:hypothetical protein FACS189437_00620 [Bacteroidia bacterium]
MNKKPIYNRIEKLNNHGIEQGVVPRFILQISEMQNNTFIFKTEEERNQKVGLYTNIIVNHLCPLYDLYQEILFLNSDYKENVLNGSYISIDERGIITTDRIIEEKIKNSIKVFFINGKILINTWADSHVVDDGLFCLSKLLFVKDKDFRKQKETYNTQDSKDRKYSYIFEIIENARNMFLKQFTNIRNDIEHHNFIIPNYLLNIENGIIIFEEPTLEGKRLVQLVGFYYNYICELIELVMVYYYGINSYCNSYGLLCTYETNEYDYKALKYRFFIKPRQQENSELQLIIGN